MNENRELVTLAELSARLTDELQRIDEADGSTISVQYTLQEPDAQGCNWSESVVVRVGPNASREALMPYVTQMVQDARMKFNVKG